MLPVGFAWYAPGIGQEVISGSCDIPRVGRISFAVTMVGTEGKVDDVLTPLAERRMNRVEVTRVFAPRRSQRCLDGVACGDTGQSHSVALTKTVPVRAVLMRAIDRGTVSGRD